MTDKPKRATAEELREARRRGHAKSIEVQRAKQRLKDDAFRADYEHFRAFGMSEEQIAARLGFRPHSLRSKVAKMGLAAPVQPFEERMIAIALDKLIASGRKFSTEDLPESESRYGARDAIRKAADEGRIVKYGTGRSPYHNGKVLFWQAAEAARPAEFEQTA